MCREMKLLGGIAGANSGSIIAASYVNRKRIRDQRPLEVSSVTIQCRGLIDGTKAARER